MRQRAVAILLARWVLGLIFLMAGYWKVFELGPLVHAERFFVGPYTESWIPIFLLWSTGTLVPVIELFAGAMMIMGFRVEISGYLLGAVLVLVTYGHLLTEPLYDFTGHVIPRLALLLFVLWAGTENDRFSLDHWLARKSPS